MSSRKGKTTCGDYGGKRANGSPCTRKAGWGTDRQTGPCKDHDDSAEARLAASKRAFLEAYLTGLVSMGKAAATVGVDRSTIWRWRREDPEFDELVTTARDQMDRLRVDMVEDSLFQRIVAGKAAAVEVIFWLKNRAPDRWKDRQTLEHEGLMGTPVPVTIYIPDNGRDRPATD